MANCILAFPDFVLADPAFATVTFSGGAWMSALPLSNLLRPEMAYVARSINAAITSTRFFVDLGVARGTRGIFIPYTNGSSLCLYRMRAMDAPVDGATVTYDTGWRPLFGVTYPPLTLPWGNPSVWDGKLYAEDVAFYPMPIVEVFPNMVLSRYWLIEFDDRFNTDGYFQLPTIVVSGGWQPSINMQWTASLAVEDPTVVQFALGGALYFDKRPKKRVQRFALGFLTLSEALAQINDMHRRLGVSGRLFFVTDPDDRVNMHRGAFLARMRVLNQLEYTAMYNTGAPFELEELIA